MSVFSNSGASVSTSVVARVAFISCRCCMSPTMRWEKNSIGRDSTFHM